MKAIQVLNLAVVATLTATANGAALDVAALHGEGRLVLNSTAGAVAGNTLDVKLQDSPDGVNGWADTGHAFAQVTNAASHQVIAVNLDGLRKFVRVVDTIAGTTPSFVRSVELVGKAVRV